MIKSVKWFFVVLVFGSIISLSFSKENVRVERFSVGDRIPGLVLCDTLQALNLHDSAKGFTLLSFWASYDAVSRQKNAALAHFVTENSSKMRIVSVSFDRYVSVFRAAVHQDGLPEKDCFVETDGPDSEVFKTFGLKHGLCNYLLDSRGVIVAKNVTASELASFLN